MISTDLFFSSGLIVERTEREDLYPDVANLAKEHIRDQKNVLLRYADLFFDTSSICIINPMRMLFFKGSSQIFVRYFKC
jgi:hypothetical protein